MKVTLALLCDSANVAADGKLNILGQFSQIASPAFPCELPLMQLALRFEAQPSDAGAEHELLIRLVNADGNRIGELGGLLTVPPFEPSGEPSGNSSDGSTTLQTVVPLPNITFPEPGAYALHLLIDGEGSRSVGLDVIPAIPLEEVADAR